MSDATKISTEDYNKEEFEKISKALYGYKLEDCIKIFLNVLVEKGLITSKDIEKQCS